MDHSPSQDLSQDQPRRPSWKTLFTRGLLLAALCCSASLSAFADETPLKPDFRQEASVASTSLYFSEATSFNVFVVAFFDRLDFVLDELDLRGPTFVRQEEDDPQLNDASGKL